MAMVIEQVLLDHPAVAEATVVRRADDRLGEVPVAAVVPAGGGAVLDAEDVLGHCREWLASFKVPRAVHLFDELPRTPTNKVRKQDVIRMLNEQGTNG